MIGFWRLGAALALWLSLSGPASAQEQGEPPFAASAVFADSPRPQQPPGQSLPQSRQTQGMRRLVTDVTRGTWLSLDVAPDGRTLVMDILGDLYRLSVTGGTAVRITSGVPFDTQPTYSRDGKFIAFVSDRSGADNLWIARPDGSGARQVSFGEDDSVLVSPAWAPDGRAIYVSRYRPDLNNYELWRYDLVRRTTLNPPPPGEVAAQGADEGGGSPNAPSVLLRDPPPPKGEDLRAKLIVPIRDTPSAPRDRWRSTLGAVVSPDGRWLYAAQLIGGLDFARVDHWTIVRRDLVTGAEQTIVTLPDGPRTALNPGAFFRPALSPDGRSMAYATREAGHTDLRLRDLATGADHLIASPIEHDQLQSSMWQDLLPRYAFTPDDEAIILSVRGAIQRIALTDGAATPIAFKAHLDLPIGPSTRQDIREETGPVHARLIMAPVVSPDRQKLAFSAMGRLYTMPLDGSAPRPFAAGADAAFEPSWSPDGRRLTWVSWSERNAGAVWTAPGDGLQAPTRLSTLPAAYSYPVFTPDGAHILALRSAQQARLDVYMEYGKLHDAELVEWNADGGSATVVTQGQLGSRPQFANGTTYILADDGLDAVDLATGKRQLAVQVKGPGWYFQDGAVPVDDLRISPDGKWLLAQVAQQLHVVAMPAKPAATIDLSAPLLPHRRISAAGADYFEWSADGSRIDWTTGSTLHSRPLAGITPAPADHPSWVAEPRTDDIASYHADVTMPRAVASGRLLLHGARVLTMAPGDPVIPAADILIDDGRFAQVGPVGSFVVPPGTAIRDVSGSTILPGFIDTHDHVATVRRDILGLEDWGLRARLAAGVTTSFDPSTLTIDMLAYQDLLDAGLMTGPRIRQTGVALFSMQRFTSLDDVLAVMRRYRDDYRIRNIKEYRTGDRRVREWVAQACAELGMQPTTEGALSMRLDLSQILDGYAGNEHALVASPLQEDVLALLKTAHTSYTTTLNITNGGPEGEDWAIARDDPGSDPTIQRWWPQLFRDQLFQHADWRPLGEYRFPAIAADAARLQGEGGLVGIGSHGEAPGIGLHWEMELHGEGGMTPLAVLHAATIGSAETIGRKSDLGSIEPGKIADLVVLSADPLADIHNARAVTWVMRDGHLYDARDLAEVWPNPHPLSPSWFVSDDATAQWLPTVP